MSPYGVKFLKIPRCDSALILLKNVFEVFQDDGNVHVDDYWRTWRIHLLLFDNTLGIWKAVAAIFATNAIKSGKQSQNSFDLLATTHPFYCTQITAFGFADRSDIYGWNKLIAFFFEKRCWRYFSFNVQVDGPRQLATTKAFLQSASCSQVGPGQSCKSGRYFRVGFGPKGDKISGLIRAWDVLFVLGAQKYNKNNLFETFFSKQHSPMYFYLNWRFAPQSGEHPRKSNAFLVCKNKNETSQKKYRWSGMHSYDVTTKKYTTFVITTCNITEKLLHLPKVLYSVY